MDFVKIPGGTTQSQQIAAMNNNFSQLANESVTKIYNDNNGVPNISIGVQPDGTSRIRIAQTGIDVTVATDEQLSFDSSRKTFQIIGTPLTTSFSVTSTAVFAATTVTIVHGLGYEPLTESVAYVTTNGWQPTEVGTYPLPYQSMATASTIRGYAAYVILKRVTSSSITYEVGITGGTLTLAGTISCYIKQST